MTSQDIFQNCATAQDAIDALQKIEAEHLRLGIFDTDAILREKTVSRQKAEKLLLQGSSFSDVLYKWDIAQTTYSGGAFADELTAIDPTSGRHYPFASSTALFLMDFVGPHAGISPRNLAKLQIQRAARMGYGVRAGFEYEFFLFQETPDSLRAKDYRNLRSFAVGNQAYSAVTSAVEGDFISGLTTTMAGMGIELDSFHTELGPGCFEAPLLAREGLRAADDAALFKTFAKAYAQRQGHMATFMAKWSNDWPGQSGHLHLSLFDLESNSPVFMDQFMGQDEKMEPNQLLHLFLGGLLTYLPETLVMSAHTANAYRRLVPGSWAPTHASWGVENRSCAVRAITHPTPAARIEFRVPSADSNPYLAIAACLACGLTGIEEQIDPPEASRGDAYEEVVEDDRRFPRNLLEAAERFGDSRKARDLFGNTFVDWFVKTRKWEDQVHR
ncbi:glutamine synthetase, partial [Gammaproteobacteria bacterium]|nr:glutamine synthetase [Gammaproteobacteria bacterium]